MSQAQKYAVEKGTDMQISPPPPSYKNDTYVYGYSSQNKDLFQLRLLVVSSELELGIVALYR